MRSTGVLIALLLVGCGSGQSVASGPLDAAACDGAGAGCGDAAARRDAASADAPSDSADGSASDDAGQDSGPPPAAPTYLVNPAHTGSLTDAGVSTPLRLAWIATLGGAVSFPLVANGVAYVTTNGTPTAHAMLVAVATATGAPAWTADLGTAPAATIAYDEGRIFSMDEKGAASTAPALRAFDAASGMLVWTAHPDNEFYFDSPPVAYRGIVYVRGTGDGGAIYAYDESTGTIVWRATEDGGEGSPAVSDDGVFLSEGCGSVVAFDRVAGTKLWQTTGSCDGEGSATSVLSGTTLYVVDTTGNLEIDVTSGQVVGSFQGDLPPAFDGSRGFALASGQLYAFSNGLATPEWGFEGDGRLAAVPFVAGGTVYVGSSEGNLFALDEATGAELWSANTGYPLVTQETFAKEPRVALAGGDGVVLVPVGSTLTAYASASIPDAGTDGASDAGCTYRLTLQPPVITGQNPQSIVIGDLNGDGIPDLAVSNSNCCDMNGAPGYVTTNLGHGDGTFAAGPVQYMAGVGTAGIASGDFNRDGKLDVAVANTYNVFSDAGPLPEEYDVSVLFGNGDGSLQPQVAYGTGTYPYAVAVGDLDHGTPDLAVSANGLDVLLNRGGGTFGAAVAYPAGNGAYGLALGDLDGDGVLDAVVMSDGDDGVGVLLGKGDGTFQPQTIHAVGTEPGGVVVADVDLDGHLDIAVTGSTNDTVGVFYGLGDGTFAALTTYPAGLQPSGVVVADLNRDGLPDLAVTNTGASTASVLLGVGGRQFAPQFVVGTGAWPVAIASADLNHDGWSDLAVVDANDNTVAVFLGGCSP